MSVDTAVRKYAARALAKIGTPVTIRRVTPGVYNTTTGTHTPTTVDHECPGRLDTYTERERLANPTILARDRKLTVAALDVDFAPEPKDNVVLADELTYTVENVVTEMAQHEAALYVLQLRR